MNRYLFDTNIVIDWLNAGSQAQQELLACDRPYLSRIAWIEVLVGTKAQDLSTALASMAVFTILEVTVPVAARTVQLRGQHRRMKLPDALIYATAQEHDLTLVTRNTRDFDQTMPGVRVPYTLAPGP